MLPAGNIMVVVNEAALRFPLGAENEKVTTPCSEIQNSLHETIQGVSCAVHDCLFFTGLEHRKY